MIGERYTRMDSLSRALSAYVGHHETLRADVTINFDNNRIDITSYSSPVREFVIAIGSITATIEIEMRLTDGGPEVISLPRRGFRL